MPVLWPHETIRKIIMHNIIIYTQALCGYCEIAKREFEKRGWKYTAYSINEGPLSKNNRASLMERLPNATTVPQIWIDDNHIGGYDELMEWIKTDFFKGRAS